MTSRTIVLITGCSEGGIGFSLAQEFAKQGCKVYATARSLTKMKSFEAHSDITPLVLEVTDEDSIRAAIDSVISQAGKIDILVNNAGIACYGPILDVSMDTVRKVYETNVFSILNVTRAVLPHMASKNSGTIVNIGSVVGEIHTPWAGVYSSSKAAMMAVSNVLEMECRPFNVKVLLVSPGGVRSAIASNAKDTYTGLPSNSLWHKYSDNVILRMFTSQSPGSLPVDAFAKRVVAKALKKPPPMYMTLGSNSTILWLLQWFPRWVINGYLWRRFGRPVKLQKN